MSTKKPKKAAKKSKTAAARPTRNEAEQAIRTLIEWLGEDAKREGLRDTPARVVRAFEEYAEGYAQDPAKILAKTFQETGGYGEAVLIRDIEFESRCEHHMAPFIGKIHVAYMPRGRVVGLSKIARLVDAYARRLQTQERMTMEIAKTLEKYLKPRGVAIMAEAEHFCMKVRGVHKTSAVTVTTYFGGKYRDNDDLREEFLLQVRK